MFYHNITHDDMLNGYGLRVVLWVSGCEHNCYGCHNPETHNPLSGIVFDENAVNEIFEQLDKEYISGITLSGGDPLHKNNIFELFELVSAIRSRYGNTKTIWIYSGYTMEQIFKDDCFFNCEEDVLNNNLRKEIIKMSDIFVDGRYVESLKDEKYHWAGSTNQRIIDVKKYLGR